MVLHKRTVTSGGKGGSEKVKVKSAEKETGESWNCKNVLLNISKGLLLIIVLPAFLNFSALIREEKELKPEGVLIDVRYGQKLFKTCNGTGSPTVILDAPVGETSDVWSLVFPAIAKFTKVCMYDRAGLGYSDQIIKGMNESKHAGKGHTVERMVEDFHRLFDNEEKPFILVGADLGAIVAKFYIQMFHDSVASAVFINPIYEGIFLGGDANPWSKYWYNSLMPSLQLQHILSAIGITRLGLQTGFVYEPMGFTETPDVVRRRQKYLKCKPGHVSSVVEESHFLNETLSQCRTLQKLRPYPKDIPTSIFWTDQYTDRISRQINQVWLKSQEMFSKSFSVDNHETVQLKGFLLKNLFLNYKKIVKVIKTSVIQYRKKSKVESMY